MNAVAADSGDPGVKAHAALVGLWIRLFMSPEGWPEDALSEATRGIAVFEQLGDGAGAVEELAATPGLVHLYTTQFRPSEEAWERSSVHAHLQLVLLRGAESLSWVPICVWAGPTPVDEALERCRNVIERARVREEGPVHRTLRPGRARGGARQIRRSAGSDRAVEGFAGGVCTYRLDRRAADAVRGLGRPLARRRRGGREATSLGPRDIERDQGDGMAPNRRRDPGRGDLRQGRVDEADDLAVAISDAAGSEDVYSQLLWRGVRAKVFAGRGSVDDAERLARESVELVAGTHFFMGTGNRGDDAC